MKNKIRMIIALIGFATITIATPSCAALQPGQAVFGYVNSIQSVVTQECDNVFMEWTRTNNYVKTESDPLFNSWLSTYNWGQYLKIESDPMFNTMFCAETLNVTNKQVKFDATADKITIGTTTLSDLLDITGKGEMNKINSIKTNGTEVAISSDKSVDIVIPKVDIPSIATNGVDVAVTDNKINIAIPDVPIKSVTTNGTEFSVRNGVVTIPLDEYVRLKDLQEGITFDNLSATNLTVNGKQVSVEGHKHDVSDITNLVPVTISTISTNGVAITPNESRNVEISIPAPLAGLWAIPGAEAAANTAIQKIDAAQNMNEVKAALKEFLENFKKPTP